MKNGFLPQKTSFMKFQLLRCYGQFAGFFDEPPIFRKEVLHPFVKISFCIFSSPAKNVLLHHQPNYSLSDLWAPIVVHQLYNWLYLRSETCIWLWWYLKFSKSCLFFSFIRIALIGFQNTFQVARLQNRSLVELHRVNHFFAIQFVKLDVFTEAFDIEHWLSNV